MTQVIRSKNCLNFPVAPRNGDRHNYLSAFQTRAMKKILKIMLLSLVMACGSKEDGSGGKETAAEEEVDKGAGEEISPQMEVDSTKSRVKVDSVSSTKEAEKESDPDTESF